MITNLAKEDITQLVKLYRRELPGFLSDLGEEFLMKFFLVSLSLPEMNTIVEKENGKIITFVTYCTKVKGLYKRVIFSDIYGFICVLSKYFITHINTIPKVLSAITYPGFNDDAPELLTIVVDKKHLGRGLGKKLFRLVCNKLENQGFTEFKISTYDYMKANGFYLRMGCRKTNTFGFLGKRMNYYVYNIPLTNKET